MNESSALAEMGDRGHDRHGPKIGAGTTVPISRRAGTLSNTMWPEPRPAFIPSGILMQASDAMTSRLPRYEAKCVQRRCFQCASVPLRSDIKGMELPPANILIPLERQLITLQLCR